VGSERFVREMADKIRGRQQLVIEGAGDSWTLKEPATPYIAFSGPETKCKGLHFCPTVRQVAISARLASSRHGIRTTRQNHFSSLRGCSRTMNRTRRADFSPQDRGDVGRHRKLRARGSVRGPCGLKSAFRFVGSALVLPGVFADHEPWRQPSVAASEPGFPAGRQDAALTGRLEARLRESQLMRSFLAGGAGTGRHDDLGADPVCAAPGLERSRPCRLRPMAPCTLSGNRVVGAACSGRSARLRPRLLLQGSRRSSLVGGGGQWDLRARADRPEVQRVRRAWKE